MTDRRVYTAYVAAMSAVLLAGPSLSYFGRELGAPRNWQYVLSPLLVVALAVVNRWRAAEPLRLPRWVKVALAVSLCAFCVGVQLGKYWSFAINGVDFSIFDWMLYNSNHGAFGFSPIYAVNHFGVHANYVLLPLIAVHRLVPSHYLLLFVTAAAVALAAIPLWRLGVSGFDHEGMAALLVLAYVTNPYVAVLLDGGFRPEAFYPLFGFGFALAWTERRTARWVLWALAFLCIKEDAAFYTIAFCVGVLLFEGDRWRPAVAVGVLALGLLLLNVGCLQPLWLRPYGVQQPTYVGFWGQYGASLPEILRNMATSPLPLAKDILTSGWWKLFAPALFLPLLSRRALMPMLPTLFILGSASAGAMHGFTTYYPITLIPFFFWGLAEAWQVVAKTRRVGAWRMPIFAVALLAFPLMGGGYSKFTWPRPGMDDALADAVAQVDAGRGPVCAQTALFPHLPYAWDLRPLFDECANVAGARLLLNPNLSPWPHDREWVEALARRAREKGLLREFPEGFLLVVADR